MKCPKRCIDCIWIDEPDMEDLWHGLGSFTCNHNDNREVVTKELLNKCKVENWKQYYRDNR